MRPFDPNGPGCFPGPFKKPLTIPMPFGYVWQPALGDVAPGASKVLLLALAGAAVLYFWKGR